MNCLILTDDEIGMIQDSGLIISRHFGKEIHFMTSSNSGTIELFTDGSSFISGMLPIGTKQLMVIAKIAERLNSESR